MGAYKSVARHLRGSPGEKFPGNSPSMLDLEPPIGSARKNMALVNGGFLHYRDMKKFLKNLLLRNCWSDFKIISQECSFGDPFQKLFAKF